MTVQVNETLAYEDMKQRSSSQIFSRFFAKDERDLNNHIMNCYVMVAT